MCRHVSCVIHTLCGAATSKVTNVQVRCGRAPDARAHAGMYLHTGSSMYICLLCVLTYLIWPCVTRRRQSKLRNKACVGLLLLVFRLIVVGHAMVWHRCLRAASCNCLLRPLSAGLRDGVVSWALLGLLCLLHVKPHPSLCDVDRLVTTTA